MKIVITHDVFDISKRIKNINNHYYICYDTKLDRFEIHNSDYTDSLCLVLPYKSLDCRALEYVYKSQRVEEVIEEIEEHNRKLEMSNQQNIMDRTNYQFNEIYKYANKKVKDFDGKAYKFNWC